MDFFQTLSFSDAAFRTSESVRKQIKTVCEREADIAQFVSLGESEKGRPIDAVVLGNGKTRVSLIAGAHSDEPVGPETLRWFILEGLQHKTELQGIFRKYTFCVVPHINPDGEIENQPWIEEWPDLPAYIRYAFRELPGRDLEFGFPDMRQENKLVSGFLQKHAPFDLHMSLHGMGIAEGAMLLIEKNWIDRTAELRVKYTELLVEAGLPFHDHDRKGDKGFVYISPGFTTTPQGSEMRKYFESQDEPDTAGQFHDSSMEFVRSLSEDPLCLVTELPLFVMTREIRNRPAGVPKAYLEFKELLPELRAKAEKGQPVDELLAPFGIRPVPLPVQIKIQFATIALGLKAIHR